MVIPSSPSVLKSIRDGFNAITDHLILVLFPVSLDLLLWFGPHLRIRDQIFSLLDEMSALSSLNSGEMTDLITTGEEFWRTAAERINLLVSLRSYPIGVFSLLSSIYPIEHPLGEPAFFEISTLGGAVLLGLVLMVVGICLGAVFFSAVKQAALHDEMRWRDLVQKWPRHLLQSLWLGLIWLGLFLAVTVVGSCAAAALLLIGPMFGQLAVLVLGVIYTWMLFPLFFSPHGIFSRQLNAWRSVVESIKLTNLTFLKTGLFILFAVLASQGMDVLWRTPPEDSWLMALSILGHSFVTTGVLAASFVYYRKVSIWLEEIQALREVYSQGVE